MVYPAREDSLLLQTYVKKWAHGSVLDVGTGLGIQAETAASKKSVKKVTAVDIDSEAVAYCERHHEAKKITFFVSDLFYSVAKIKFDPIIFNPPYLPADPKEAKEDAIALAGGKNGHELLERFLKDAADFLKHNGQMLIIFTSLTNKGIVNRLIEQNGFDFEELERKKCFMETIYCYRILWNPIIPKLRKQVHHISYLSHGKRGVIFVGLYKGKKVAVKIKKKDSAAIGRLKNEAYWLKRLNKEGIGPRLVSAGEHHVLYTFVEGEFILNFIEKSKPLAVKRVLFDVLRQCFTLDQLGVNKEEMHHPVKHIIVKGNNAVMIDFERVHNTSKPKNVTQFVQFIRSIAPLLKKKGLLVNVFTLRRCAEEYKKYPDLAHVDHI